MSVPETVRESVPKSEPDRDEETDQVNTFELLQENDVVLVVDRLCVGE